MVTRSKKAPVTKKSESSVVQGSGRDLPMMYTRLIPHGKIKINNGTQVLNLSGKGTATVVPDKPISSEDDFTVEAVVTPTSLRKNQYLMDSENPPIRIEIKSDGEVVGSIHTDKGWESVRSGDRKIGKNETASIRLIRENKGVLELEINDRRANQINTDKGLAETGDTGITIGGDVTGKKYLFSGEIAGIRMRKGAVRAVTIDGYHARATTIESQLKAKLKYPGRLEVFVDPDIVDTRFDEVKAILSSAGVEDVSQLATLKIDSPTVIQKNQIMVAPPKTNNEISWSATAAILADLEDTQAVELLATLMANKNSKSTLNKLTLDDAVEASKGKSEAASKARNDTLALLKKIIPKPAEKKLTFTPQKFEYQAKALTRSYHKPLMQDIIKPTKGVEFTNPEIINDLDSDNPEVWPLFQAPLFFLNSINAIPVDTSVIIAGVLDLTNQALTIEPDVKKLYIIAEKIIGDTNAQITWRKPGGHTPARQADPNKNGRSYSGVHTASGSRNGLAGGDGQAGIAGIAGANGIDAPDLEIWVKELTAMPDIDLEGEEGIKGGRGQQGGRGGNGARGAPGEWFWAFGIHCWKSPGHGGNGGDGGNGGRGGYGGDGGRGGYISIGVLEGTLAASVEARAFKINNDGGNVGRGGDGGSGGLGGYGGTHGNDYVNGKEVCKNGVDGARGAQGQPGAVGTDGREGVSGAMRFFEFTEESWNEQLTKPWLFALTPSHVFPGDTLNITGTRFASSDRVIIDGISLQPTIELDESITVNIPANMTGGEKNILVRRFDGDESNQLRLWVKPRLDLLPTDLAPEMIVTLTGRAFLTGAKVLYNGLVVESSVQSSTTMTFTVPGTGGVNVAETDITVAVRNPDGEVSNTRNATVARTLDTGIRIGVHDFAFDNFAAGTPSWGTYEDTYGAFEIWHELLDPIFGHPILTAAFYGFYHHFLKGIDNGGLATGFCTSMSTVVLDEYYTGSSDTHTRYSLDAATKERFTAIHGRLLSRESLIDFHDQGSLGNANVETVFRRFENSMLNGSDRESALMLFFVPSGTVWDAGYIDKLGDSHCIVPIRMVYPVGHDGTSIAGVRMYCWDCNHPVEEGAETAYNCYLEFRLTDGEIRFDYYTGTGSTPHFCSEDGITLASMSNGKYLLSDHDLPFSGPFGLTRFVVDFLLSPADLLIEDGSARQTGLHAGNIVAEIPNSHPAYLAKNLYLLPADTALTRRITGNASGSYEYHSVAPNGTSISLENVTTIDGEEDILSVNADSSQIRFTPSSTKTFTLNLARELGDHVRAVSIQGGGAGPVTEMDMTISPDLSVIRMGNKETARNVDIRVTAYNVDSGTNSTNDTNGVNLPTDHDLLVTVTDWSDLAVTVRSLPFNGA